MTSCQWWRVDTVIISWIISLFFPSPMPENILPKIWMPWWKEERNERRNKMKMTIWSTIKHTKHPITDTHESSLLTHSTTRVNVITAGNQSLTRSNTWRSTAGSRLLVRANALTSQKCVGLRRHMSRGSSQKCAKSAMLGHVRILQTGLRSAVVD